jgi:coenzyme PQQ precursor peptide PqqA
MVLTLPVEVRRSRLRPGVAAESVGFTKRLFPAANQRKLYHFWRRTMWTKPEFTEMRFGFEVTMYIANR